MLPELELLLDMVRLDSGRRCRSCGTVIASRDHLGVSEGICPACRG
jgi:hypothetical protein